MEDQIITYLILMVKSSSKLVWLKFFHIQDFAAKL